MQFEFADDDLKRLYVDQTFTAGLAPSIVKGFRKAMGAIRAAPDEREFYSKRALHFEKLMGKRQHQHSLRINDQYRLVIELQGSSPNKTVRVISIEDYH